MTAVADTPAEQEFVNSRRRALNEYQAQERVTDDLFRALVNEHIQSGHEHPMVTLCPICADA